MKNGKRRRFFLCLMWPFVVLMGIAAASPLWFPQLGYYLVVSDPLKRSDAIVALGGGDPQRIIVATRLYQEKWAPIIIASGDLTPDYVEALGEKLTYAELGAKLIIGKGVPPENVVIIKRGTSTFEEAIGVKEYAQEKKFRQIIVVTSIYHTRRTRAVYRKIFGGSGIEVIIRPAEGGKFSTDRWWTREDDLVFVNSEWVKLILYKVQGKI
jgi:uncharacterized SAM-binding protein YcdF (DUF218 family)